MFFKKILLSRFSNFFFEIKFCPRYHQKGILVQGVIIKVLSEINFSIFLKTLVKFSLIEQVIKMKSNFNILKLFKLLRKITFLFAFSFIFEIFFLLLFT